MIRYFGLLLFMAIAMPLSAQEKDKKEKTVQAHGQVLDAKTKEGPDSVFITLMRSDSTVVDTCHTRKFALEGFFTRPVTFYSIDIPAKADTYIIKGEHPGYHTGFTTLKIKSIGRNREFEIPTLYLRPLSRMETDTLSLDEVVVKATRIKMVMRGDTIVYNADAFNLGEGSMLDALVRQLPGAELNSDGEIKVNGEKVDELTLNGRDFFKGNNKIMLENLPSFTVKNIEVFHKTSEKSKWAGKQLDKKLFTMDVVLKRQYNTGILGNVEAGAGTDERYLGRLFAMRYTDCSRLSVFANTNNVNEERKPGQNGDWDPTKVTNGQKKTNMVGADILIDEKEHRWREQGSVTFQWDKTINNNYSNSESFLQTGNTFSRNMAENTSHNKRLNVENNFMLMKPIWMTSYVNASYTSYDNTIFSRSAYADRSMNQWGNVQSSLDSIFAATLKPELQQILINRSQNNALNDGHSFNINNYNGASIKLPNGDMIDISLTAGYNNRKSNNYSQQKVDYFRKTGQDINLNKYNRAPSHKYNYDVAAGYYITLSETYSFMPQLEYAQEYSRNNREYYLTEKFGLLPSNRSEQLAMLDLNNTYETGEMKRATSLNIIQRIHYSKDSMYVWADLHLPLKYNHENFDYYSPKLNDRKNRKYFSFEPRYFLMANFGKYNVMLRSEGQLNIIQPSMLSMINRKNDENPLMVQLGNPNLKSTISERVSVSATKQWRKEKIDASDDLSITWNASQRAVAQGFTVDMNTGVYTIKPVNVDGNWSIDINNNNNINFGKDKVWNLTNNLGYNFNNNVDMAAAAGSQQSGISKVRTNTYTETLSFGYRKGDLSLGVNGNITYRHSTSDNKTFQTVNATNFAYGFNGSYLIPWMKLTVATDIKMFSRRGYAAADFNTNDLVWNASISKPLIKGKLVARLEAFDILHQLTNTNIVINAQGRTETFTNTIPRYAMLHLQWNFNKMPKAKMKNP